jgi:hypothetical protein
VVIYPALAPPPTLFDFNNRKDEPPGLTIARRGDLDGRAALEP